MKAPAAKALGVIGAAALGIGLANMVAPGSIFPSAMTCVTDFDFLICTIYGWPMAPWLALGGGVAIVAAVSLLRDARHLRPSLPDDTT